jgi:uncharacterized protein YcbX
MGERVMPGGQQIGTIGALYRFPVKSMGGESLQQVALAWHGFDADRGYAFVQSGKLVRFPWLTARDVPALVRYTARLSDPTQTRTSAVRVLTPGGEDVPVDDETLRATLEDQHGSPLHLMRLGRGSHDVAPVSMIGLGTIRELGRRVGQALDVRRFRQNIYLEPTGGEPFIEEEWAGRLLVFGDGDGAARLRLLRRDHRCMIVNLDPDLGTPAPSILREIAQSRDNCAGLYASVEAPGLLAVGAPVYLAE